MLIVNSSASSVTPRGKVVIQKSLSADHDVTLVETNRRGHATRLAQGAVKDGYDAVVCLGGDGTLNEVANGLAGSSVALAPLPGGSTNVFARTIGLPNDPIEATAVLLHGLATEAIRPIGLGVVNGRYFLFHVGVGYDAEVVAQVEKRAGLKRYAGHPLFIWASLTSWFRHYDHRRPRFTLQTGEHRIDDGRFTICMNTNPYTYLGHRPLDLVSEATLDRPLAAVTMRSMQLGTILGAVGAAFGIGKDLKRRKNIDVVTDRDQITITGHGSVPYQVDGDYLGEIELLEFRHEPDALRLVFPNS